MTTHARVLSFVGSVSLLIMLMGCGGGDGGNGPSKFLSRIEISPGTTAIKIGQGESFTVTGIYSDGTSQSETAAWESDTPGVLTISGSGRAQSVSAGKATIIARVQGQVDTQLIQVVPDYQGTWQGDYRVTRCEVSGDFREVQNEVCGSDGFRIGTLLPIQVTVSQSGAQLTGTLSLGEITGPLTGPVKDPGNFEGTASLTFTVEGEGTIAMAVNPLRLQVEGERMTGSFTVESTAAGATGSWILGADLKSVTRTSTTEMPRGREDASFASWREMLRAFAAQ